MRYRQRITFDGYRIWESDGGTPRAWLESERDEVSREAQFDSIGRLSHSVYRQTRLGQRTYTVSVILRSDTPAALDALLAQWRQVHTAAGGERELERITASGRRFYLDCVPAEPAIARITPWAARIEQAYLAALPFWRGALATLDTAFNGTTPVEETCTNEGDVATWLNATIAGPVEEPQIELADGTLVGFALTVGAGETLHIAAIPPAQVLLDNTNVYGYRTEDTDFNNFVLPVGDSQVTLTATSGNGTCTLWWYPLYEALY